MSKYNKSIINFFFYPPNEPDIFCRTISAQSFIIGTSLLFILYLGFTPIVLVGMYFVVICFLINSASLFILLVSIADKLLRKKNINHHLITLLIILANIPITFFYLVLVDLINPDIEQ